MRRAPELVAIAGDWHGNTAWAVHCVHQAARRGVDVIVQVGDFGLWPGKWGVEYLDELNQALDDAGVDLVWVDGNHDDHDQLAKWHLSDGVHQIRKRIAHLPRGYRWQWHGKTWLALGGAVSIDRARRIPTRTWWADEVITEDDVTRCVAGGPADVMICHDSPAGAEVLTEHLREFGFPCGPSWRRIATITVSWFAGCSTRCSPTCLFTATTTGGTATRSDRRGSRDSTRTETSWRRTSCSSIHERWKCAQLIDPISDPEVIIEKIRVAVNQLAGLNFAYIFGSFAARWSGVDGPPPNDIDVLLIGDISRGEKSRLYGELNREVGGIEVNPYGITLAMWEADAPDIFVRDVRASPLIPLVPLLTEFELAYRDSEARRIVEESRASGTRTTWKPGPPTRPGDLRRR